MDDTKQLIVTTTSELLSSMGFETDVSLRELDNRLWVQIETPEPQLLIGREGTNLITLKHVLKLIIRNKASEPLSFEVDVNNYRQQKISLLKEVARTLAERVISSGHPLSLKPMSAFERRIIHVELASHGEVVTESIGEEPERRLVIKPTVSE